MRAWHGPEAGEVTCACFAVAMPESTRRSHIAQCGYRLTWSERERTPHATQRRFQRVASAPFSAALAAAAATAVCTATPLANLERAVGMKCLVRVWLLHDYE